ncbi:hypothetical protein QJS10_CPB11g01757 [Acorus calamus]|uniref:3-hydroxyisobutyrate dehydrogenase n=1 Tax=Acorus calamus TaxID=4465 RepID=A0AAV9DTE5_ACOCL|nr:hypothetical protein QJS10_CPB11g01757 [Acorus calamus]
MASRARALALKTMVKLGSTHPIRRFCSTPVPSDIGKVGFIGLGNMGSHMASNLIDAGFELVVHDINCEAMKKFVEKGVPTKETPLQLAESSDVVITMLPSSSHVLDVYTGSNGLLHGGPFLRPWLFIDSSTIDPQTSRSLSATISKCTLEKIKGSIGTPVMLDAPVSGGVPGAEAGTLTFMVGGLEEAYLAAKPLFHSMGKCATYCGRSGNGATRGLELRLHDPYCGPEGCLNSRRLVVLAAVEGISSMVRLHHCNPSQPQDPLASAFNQRSNKFGDLCDHVNKNFQLIKRSLLEQAKDLELAAASAEQVGHNCRLASQALDIYKELCKRGHESKDFSCVFRQYYSGKDEN